MNGACVSASSLNLLFDFALSFECRLFKLILIIRRDSNMNKKLILKIGNSTQIKKKQIKNGRDFIFGQIEF